MWQSITFSLKNVFYHVIGVHRIICEYSLNQLRQCAAYYSPRNTRRINSRSACLGMPSISPVITNETLHCVHQHKIKDEPTSNPQNNGFNDGVSKKNEGFARVLKGAVYTVWIFICIRMSLRVFLFAKKVKFLTKGGFHCISQVFPWHFYLMREHSLVALTEHDDSAANIIVHSMCVCVFFPSILDIKFVGRTSRGHTGGRSHRIFNPPSFCGACLDFCREKDSAIPFPRRP